MRIYLDLCSIQRPLDDLSQLRVRAEAEVVLGLIALAEAGTVTLVASGVHRVEDRKSPFPDRRAFVSDVLGLAEYAPSMPAVLARARLYESAGMSPMDALHLASAVEATVDYFVTTDDRLLRKARTVDVMRTSTVSPLELVALLP